MTNTPDFEALVVEFLRPFETTYGLPPALSPAAVELARSMYAQGIEAAAQCVDAWTEPQELKLHVGEITTQEVRTTIAALKAQVRRIRALIPKEPT